MRNSVTLFVSITLCFLVCVPALSQDLFGTNVDYGVGDGPNCVFSIDFDGDGYNDLVTANQNSDNVSVLLGNGDGTFQSAAYYAAGDNPVSVFSIDFNGDSYYDLAVANLISDNVSILLGNGDGTFQSKNDISMGDGPASVFAYDFNSDGYNDMVTANRYGDNPDNISIRLGNGDGTFQGVVSYTVGNDAVFVIGADINDDGNIDLATANQNSGNISILLGNGDGTFQNSVDYSAGNNPRSVAFNDYDGDGNIDLAAANHVSDNISILLGNGDGSFQSPVNYSAGDGPNSICSRDFDGDGEYDLAVANHYSGTVSIFLGIGDGTFQSPVGYTAGGGTNSVFPFDFDGDGDYDLATANYNDKTVSILLNTTIPLSDIDNDGVADVDDNCPYTYNPDQLDTDGDLIGDACDSDDDNDGVDDAVDTDRLDPTICEDLDSDGCDDCAIGTDGFGPLADNDPNNDGTDTDGDGICDAGDVDDDNDGVDDAVDSDRLDPTICEDLDSDGCDDCTIGTDGFGPLADNDPNNDGTDGDGDGICDSGDNCLSIHNPGQEDTDGDGIGDICDFLCGDVNVDGSIDILDIVVIINYKYKSGPAPAFYHSADVNSEMMPDGLINILDIVYMINYKYKGGSEPVCAQIHGAMVDIDDNAYRTIKIGDQWWMAENLKVTHYRNDDVIPNITDATEWDGLATGAYCEYNNDINFVATYGRLYNWYAVNDSRILAPIGWHIPNESEWQTMADFLGGNDIAGGSMKETGALHWNSPNMGATNACGFSGIPAGDRSWNGTFDDMGICASYWTASENGTLSWNYVLYSYNTQCYRGYDYRRFGHAIRCVKD